MINVPNYAFDRVLNLGFRGFRLMSIFRFKIWWMIPSFGNSGRDVPVETQVLLLEGAEKTGVHDDDAETPSSKGTLYILFLPALEGQFRTSLQGTSENELQLCVESGGPNVQTSQVKEALFVNSGYNPFELMKDSVRILAKHKGTFSHVEDKKIPPHLDWFGWCTWDAFYTRVDPQGIREGLKSLSEGGCPAKFLIIDDGWQETVNDILKEGETPTDGIEFATRLADIKENKKFTQTDPGCTATNLIGYWGGLHPNHEPLKKYKPKIEYPVLSPGSQSHTRCGALLSLVKNGVGLINPDCVYDFYNDLHSYLASCGVDGVKVDIQNVIEALGSGYGGRVMLTKKYQEALEEVLSRTLKTIT
ncbi:UNVERIFIED_CONTAM: putative galactinol--sucrose galactosyltransferase 2 [Sesamum radiatum]|uniref:galactinol--sucrose galactosyltransferase n=1 Tax=Sesamum radiatum TaxID=300843 RepID=A0AAW2RZ70_SESRA